MTQPQINTGTSGAPLRHGNARVAALAAPSPSVCPRTAQEPGGGTGRHEGGGDADADARLAGMGVLEGEHEEESLLTLSCSRRSGRKTGLDVRP
ncbi:hypothetical protein VD0002_g1085 [Verticillium dahliae]|uniref:Uncharacterized protein n=1 Tax=Verticillium dahliae TaxID=27337 RepID=A0A2J8F5Y9_VERDA|nr:putative oxidoreductase yusZ [Verticillium dahliae VDG2]KAF3357079.1 hypothetical protein VdG1_06096 [Verticillium dahliae VDG1]PNH30949.1 hypothetical protein BJF96_g5756 [Verticillium dahliae]PNH55295.1 hypothetical protein VD0003_g2284 [Verticillium dahliae]PNH69201.1 hypothetical protein VD0002_g1085 [Verticillium dahliae]